MHLPMVIKEHNVKRLLILGAGTAGTMVANKLRPRLSREDWDITIVDQFATHYYQPGFLFIPFGIYDRSDVVKPKADFIPPGVTMIQEEIELIEPGDNRVVLGDGHGVARNRLWRLGYRIGFRIGVADLEALEILDSQIQRLELEHLVLPKVAGLADELYESLDVGLQFRRMLGVGHFKNE